MAVLTTEQRNALWAEFMSTDDLGPMAITKNDLKNAAIALDQFLSDNLAAINNAIPLPARTALTPAQKARLLMFVIRARFNTGVHS